MTRMHVLTRMLVVSGVVVLAACTSTPQAGSKAATTASTPVAVYAAGSLRGALTTIAN